MIYRGVSKGTFSHTQIAAARFAEDLLEEVKFDREFNQEPRRLSELLEAEHRLFKQVWYNRHWNLRTSIERGKHKLVSHEVWERNFHRRRETTPLSTPFGKALLLRPNERRMNSVLMASAHGMILSGE